MLLQDLKKLNLTCPVCEIYKVGLEMSHALYFQEESGIYRIHFANLCKLFKNDFMDS